MLVDPMHLASLGKEVGRQCDQPSGEVRKLPSGKTTHGGNRSDRGLLSRIAERHERQTVRVRARSAALLRRVAQSAGYRRRVNTWPRRSGGSSHHGGIIGASSIVFTVDLIEP